MVKLIHADGFFPENQIASYQNVIRHLSFGPAQYGEELSNFSMIPPGVEPVFSAVLGERVKIDGTRSGIFRKPYNHLVHFESFDSLNEWCFIIAIEKTTLNLFHHISKHGDGEISPIDAHTALDGYRFNYRNFFEWTLHTNIALQPNNGAFIRPWVFHSLEDGIVQYYRLLTDNKFRILVMGSTSTLRKQVSKRLAGTINDSKLIDSWAVRQQTKDIDFTPDGRIRQSHRILQLARESKEEAVIIDMHCPLSEMREIINADIVIWVQDTTAVDKDFEIPKMYDIKITSSIVNYIDIIERINSKRF